MQEQNNKTIEALNKAREGLSVIDEQTEFLRSVVENSEKIKKLSNELEAQSRDEKNNEEDTGEIKVE